MTLELGSTEGKNLAEVLELVGWQREAETKEEGLLLHYVLFFLLKAIVLTAGFAGFSEPGKMMPSVCKITD